jgi:O-antigen ligase
MLDRMRPFVRMHYFEVALGCFGLSFLLLPSAKSVNNFFYAFVALPGFFLLWRRALQLPWRDSGFRLFLAWLAYGVGSGIVQGDAFHMAKTGLYVFLFYSVLILAVDVSWWKSESFKRAAFWLALIYVLFSSIYLWLTGAYGFGERTIFMPARLENPNYISMLLVSLWALAAEDWLARKRYWEILLAALLLLFFVVFSLQSRTGLVGFCAVLVLLLWRWRPRASLGILAVVAALTSAYLGLTGGVDALHDWSFVARGDSYRLELWAKLLGEMQDCGSLFGCGYGYEIQSSLEGGSMPIAHSHSIFLAQALKTGLFGLSLLLAMSLYSLIRGWRTAGSWALYLAASMIMLNFDGNTLIHSPDDPWLLFHWPLAVLIALNAQRPHERPGDADQGAPSFAARAPLAPLDDARPVHTPGQQ